MNQVLLIGRITKEPELLGVEKQYLRNGIAVKNNYKSASGEYETSFFNFVAFGNTAQYISKYTKKGDLLLLKCHLSLSKITNENKKEIPVIDLIVDEIEKLHSNSQNQENVNQNKVNVDPFVEIDKTYDIDSSDLPF